MADLQDKLTLLRDFSLGLANLSKCSKRGVAALITDAGMNQVYSIGINGGPAGQEDCLCETTSKYGCIHAEINALIKSPATSGELAMIVTMAPCKQCAGAIMNFPGNIKTVYYYKSNDEGEAGVKALMDGGIAVRGLPGFGEISAPSSIHPGETLIEVMRDNNLRIRDIAVKGDIPPETVHEIMWGRGEIHLNLAIKLERATGIYRDFWLNLQENYNKEVSGCGQ